MLTITRPIGARRALVMILIAGLAASMVWAAPADAKKKKKKKKPPRVERTAEADYIGATGFRGVQDSPCVDDGIGCTVFPIEEGEKFVSVEIADGAGGPVWASVYVNGYTDGSDFHEHVCGASDYAFKLRPGLSELVVVTTQTTAGATSPCDGPATTGTVAATFSNLP